MTVLRGDLAVKQSRALIRTFKQMKEYIVENHDFFNSKEVTQVYAQIINDTERISKNSKEIEDIKTQMATKEDLTKVMNNFIDPATYKHFLILDGERIEADLAYTKIYKSAKKSICIIDNYIGLKTLDLLRSARKGVQITIFSDNNKNKDMLTKNILDDFKKEFSEINLMIKTAKRKYHDRYIAIDFNTDGEAFYLCGASSKDAGNKISSIIKIEESSRNMYNKLFSSMINNNELKI